MIMQKYKNLRSFYNDSNMTVENNKSYLYKLNVYDHLEYLIVSAIQNPRISKTRMLIHLFAIGESWYESAFIK